MKIQLIQRDGKLSNHALMLLSEYHKRKGDEVRYFRWPCQPWGDKSYCSTLFTWNRHDLPSWAEIGGTGYDTTKVLPGEVEKCRPDYTLYPGMDYSIGYTFRSCPRGCEFCVVGSSGYNSDKKHYSIYQFWNSKFRTIMLLNNNTFYDPDWKKTFWEIWDNDLTVWDGNGYDARLLDPEKLEYLYRTRWKFAVHFAFDRHEDWEQIEKALKLVASSPLMHRVIWYVMVGWKYTFQQDLDRINLIRSYRQRVYALQFRHNDPVYMALKRWTFRRGVFFSVPFRDFVANYNTRGQKIKRSERIRSEITRNLGGRRGVRSGRWDGDVNAKTFKIQPEQNQVGYDHRFQE